MEWDNALIIGLIVIILIFAGVFFFISGNGISLNSSEADNTTGLNITASDANATVTTTNNNA